MQAAVSGWRDGMAGHLAVVTFQEYPWFEIYSLDQLSGVPELIAIKTKNFSFQVDKSYKSKKSIAPLLF